MILKVDVTLNIGQGQPRKDTLEIDVPHNWLDWSDNQREEYLDDEWKEWAWNFIDGGISVQDSVTL